MIDYYQELFFGKPMTGVKRKIEEILPAKIK